MLSCHPSTALEAFLAEPRNVIVAGIRKDGRPHLSPNWFLWDGEHFYVSTTRKRAKYNIFRRDPRAELVVDDATGHRYVEIPTTVESARTSPANVSLFRAIREKHGRATPAGRRAGRRARSPTTGSSWSSPRPRPRPPGR